MIKTNNKLLKIALILSIVLNIAFVTGFVIRKITVSSHEYDFQSHFKPFRDRHPSFDIIPGKENFKDDKKYKHKLFGLKHLCSLNPGFFEVFKSHSEGQFKIMMEMTKYRSQILDELKKEKSDMSKMGKMLDEINQLNREAEKRNLDHLLSLKKTLVKDIFIAFIDRMKHMLETRIVHKQDFSEHH